MPDIEWNRSTWDAAHDWAEDGDEWSGMAAHCAQPYGRWKSALVDALLTPSCADADVLEVAPGHGRFTEYIVPLAHSVTLVDLSPTCLEVCQQRFGDGPKMTYVQTDGASLPGVPDSSIDFVWSFDSFVHMELPVIDAYLGEFARVLRPGGRFTIHHAGRRHAALRLAPMQRHGGAPGRVAYRLAAQGRLHNSGRRSDVSAEAVRAAVARHGLVLDSQVDRWGSRGQYDVTKYRDRITTGHRP